MNGYIEYTDESVFSPRYPFPIHIRDMKYDSPYDAIQDGNDPLDVMLLFVQEKRDTFYPYRYYTFSGILSDDLNRAIRALLIPKIEPVSIGRYIYLINGNVNIPPRYGIQMIRNVYILNHVNGNVYQQTDTLDTYESYHIYMIHNTPLYVGENGSFLLLETQEQDVSHILNDIIVS